MLFNWFVSQYSRINIFFGILGGFILLVLWISYAAIILLFGGMLADILDRSSLPEDNLAGDPAFREGG